MLLENLVFQHLARNLRRLRHDRELTQQQLADLSGFTQQYISQLERGMRPARREHVDVLAGALSCTVDALLTQHAWQPSPVVS